MMWYRVSQSSVSKLFAGMTIEANGREFYMRVVGNSVHFVAHTIVSEKSPGLRTQEKERVLQDYQGEKKLLQNELVCLQKEEHICRSHPFLMRGKLRKVSDEIERLKSQIRTIGGKICDIEVDIKMHQHQDMIIQNRDVYYLVLIWYIDKGDQNWYVSVDDIWSDYPFAMCREMSVQHKTQVTLNWFDAYIEQDKRRFDEIIKDAQRNHGNEGKIKAYLDFSTGGICIKEGSLQMLTELAS